MNIGLIDVDGHNYPNFALMKISAWHKQRGDTVEWAMPDIFGDCYDRIYASKIFTFSPDFGGRYNCEIVRGGTGYDIRSRLPEEIEASTLMDYTIYPQYPFSIQFFSRGCILKKEPFHAFEKRTGRHPIIGVMASESIMRRGKYLRNGGCNVFGDRPHSQPLSIWTEQDIWDYIQHYNVQIAEIYHKGARRTGCMGCGYGAHLPGDTRFKLLLQEHPKCYDMVMNYTNNGTTFREALRKVLAVNGRYLPDEEPKTLFDL